jgi:hypothetical protein
MICGYVRKEGGYADERRNLPTERTTALSLQCATGLGDDESSGGSPAGAAKAERDDDDDESDTASDATSREELDGSFMAK